MTIFKQLNSKWSSLPYPTKSSSFGGNGCGCCACVHVAIEQPWKSDYTPNSLRKWMINKGFAVAGQGTTWSGITETLKHIGHKNVVWVKRSDPMSKAWTELNKGNRIGVMLVDNSKTPDGTYWTASGHYVMFYKYQYKNGKHYFWIKDSGGRNHDGKFCYETSIKGALPQLWIVERISVAATKYRPSKAFSGALPTASVKKGSKGTNVKRVQKFLNWATNAKLDIDGVAGELTSKAICVFQKTYSLSVDGVFGNASKAKATSLINKYKADPLQKWYDAMTTQFNYSKNQTYKFVKPTVASSKSNGTCITFPAVALQRLGLLPSGAYFYLYPKTMRIAGGGGGPQYVANHSEIYSVSYPNKTVSQLGSNLKKGDICGFGNPAYHTMVYMGKNSKGEPIWNTMGHKRGLGVTYPYYANRKINMLVRLKKVSK